MPVMCLTNALLPLDFDIFIIAAAILYRY